MSGGRRLMAKLNRIAKEVREKGQLSRGEVALLLGVSPSTAYQYIRLVRDIFEDIDYRDGKLIKLGD